MQDISLLFKEQKRDLKKYTEFARKAEAERYERYLLDKLNALLGKYIGFASKADRTGIRDVAG